MTQSSETSYRQTELAQLGEHISKRESVEVIGMKRVGIGSMLTHFLSHESHYANYIRNHHKQLFVQIDLNELIERELLAFWRLSLKRIIDAAETKLSGDQMLPLKREFSNAIQSDDLFLTVEAVRTAIKAVHGYGLQPTLFFLRFDRMDHLFNHDFQNNLAALTRVTHNELVFVLTGHRRLSHLSTETYTATDFLPFMKTQFIKPANSQSVDYLLAELSSRTGLALSPNQKATVFKLSGGHIMYARLLFLLFTETGSLRKTDYLNDERIQLQSEELLQHLTDTEKNILKKVLNKAKLSKNERMQTSYLWESGIVNSQDEIFSPLLAAHIPKILGTSITAKTTPFTKKEHDLFELLKAQMPTIVTREDVATEVWPEYRTFGVSDWTIDRLISRVRKKMKDQNAPYLIETIRTRGFRLTENNSDSAPDQPYFR